MFRLSSTSLNSNSNPESLLKCCKSSKATLLWEWNERLIVTDEDWSSVVKGDRAIKLSFTCALGKNRLATGTCDASSLESAILLGTVSNLGKKFSAFESNRLLKYQKSIL